MTDERWKEVVASVKDSFEVLQHETFPLEEEEGKGEVEVVIFEGPLGRIRLERTDEYLLLDKKALGSKRIGSDSTVQYIYSDTEKIHKFKVFKWNENMNDWEKMDMEQGTFFG